MTRKLLRLIKRIFKFALKNYIITILIVIIGFVLLFASYKIFFTKPTFVYVRVQMGQVFWWAVTSKPNAWFVASLKKGAVQRNLTGKPVAEILSVRYYPAWTPQWGSNQYDVYLTLRLRAGGNKRTGEYAFNRSALSVGAPIELQFPQANITGTVIELSPKPFQDKYVQKIVYLINQGGYLKDFPFRYDNVKVGDEYFDGEATAFEVLDKRLERQVWSVQNNLTGQVLEQAVATNQNIEVKAKVLLKQKSDGFYYSENYKVIANASIPFATNNYFFENFVIRKLE